MTDDTTDTAMPTQSEWTCYMFGGPRRRVNAKGVTESIPWDGITWRPNEGEVPNVFVRVFMRVCLGCTWVRERK